MSSEWDFGGGRYKSVVFLDDIRESQKVALELAHRLRAVAQVLEAERDGLQWPSGMNMRFAYDNLVPRSASDMHRVAVKARRIDERCLWLRECLLDAEHAYRDAELRLQAESDKRNGGNARLITTIIHALAFAIPGGMLISTLTKPILTYVDDVLERVAAGDLRLEDVGVGDLLLAAAADNADGTLAGIGALVQTLLTPVLGFQTGSGTVPAARHIRSGLIFFSGSSDHDVIVEQMQETVPYRSAIHDLPPVSSSSVVDVVRGLTALSNEASALPGVIEVRENHTSAGGRTWTVLIPGTQELSFGPGSNPKDMRSNLDLLATGMADTTVGVYLAMKDAGIKPDEPVLLIGHSQGGMTAASLAGTEGIDSEFQINAMMTIGSPIGAGFDIPESVEVLSVEHSNDVITSLDGARNAPRENHTTVVNHLRHSDDPARRAVAYDIGKAHSLEVYTDTIERLVDEGIEPVDAWLTGAAAMFGSDVTVTQATRYQIRRDPRTPHREGLTQLTTPQAAPQ